MVTELTLEVPGLLWWFSWTFLVVPLYLYLCIYHLSNRHMTSVWVLSPFVLIIVLVWHSPFFIRLEINFFLPSIIILWQRRHRCYELKWEIMRHRSSPVQPLTQNSLFMWVTKKVVTHPTPTELRTQSHVSLKVTGIQSVETPEGDRSVTPDLPDRDWNVWQDSEDPYGVHRGKTRCSLVTKKSGDVVYWCLLSNDKARAK